MLSVTCLIKGYYLLFGGLFPLPPPDGFPDLLGPFTGVLLATVIFIVIPS